MKTDHSAPSPGALASTVVVFGLTLGVATGVLFQMFFTPAWRVEFSLLALLCWGALASGLLSLFNRWLRKSVPFDAPIGRSRPVTIYRPDVRQLLLNGGFFVGFILGMAVMS